jgi:hypothetical protein
MRTQLHYEALLPIWLYRLPRFIASMPECGMTLLRTLTRDYNSPMTPLLGHNV